MANPTMGRYSNKRGPKCEICSRHLVDEVRFCSIGCKVSGPLDTSHIDAPYPSCDVEKKVCIDRAPYASNILKE